MARVPDEDEIRNNLSDDPAKHDVSGFTHTHYFYNFPYNLGDAQVRSYSIYDMFSNQAGAPFLTVNSSRMLSKKESYFKLSVALALLSLFEKQGFTARPLGGIGGYNNGVNDEEYIEVSHSPLIHNYISKLNEATSPFQVQSRFTLSRAHSMMNSDPESAIIEFFKIVELFIKQTAYCDDLSEVAKRDVFARRPSIFSSNVKGSLEDGLLGGDIVDAIWKLKDIRNRFVGHGGIRPMVTGVFGDPENNAIAINYAEFVYDGEMSFGEHFFEKIMYDIEVVAVILFCKMNHIKPVYSSIPGCWWQPSAVIENILDKESVEIVQIFPSKLED